MRGRYMTSGAEHLHPEHPLELPDEIPPHPQVDDDGRPREWSPWAVSVWERLRTAPARKVWVSGDMATIEALLLVTDTLARNGVQAALMSEQRRLFDALGLTPAGRVRLGIEAEQPATRQPAASGDIDDEYRKLLAEFGGEE